MASAAFVLFSPPTPPPFYALKSLFLSGERFLGERFECNRTPATCGKVAPEVCFVIEALVVVFVWLVWRELLFIYCYYIVFV